MAMPHSKLIRKTITLTSALLLVAAGISQCTGNVGADPQLTGVAVTTAQVREANVTATELLATLPVRPRLSGTGYDRERAFGERWSDVDRNGCDTRNDVLQRDLQNPEVLADCRVQSGVLHDPYSGLTVQFTRGPTSSEDVQIDHVVSLYDAWRKGAQELTQQERVAFANDPLNLMAVAGQVNFDKGNADAAAWLPPAKGFHCEYVARQISVKSAHKLWISQIEKDALAAVLKTCPLQPAYETVPNST